MGKQRTFGAEFKARVVLAGNSGAKTPAEVCREHRLSPHLLVAWKKQLPDNAPQVFASEQNQGADAERLIRTIKEEEVDLFDYLGYHDAYQHIERFLDVVYMPQRIHSSLGYLPPAAFAVQGCTQHPAPEVVH